ncbi:hypothetical protein ACFQVC_21490 [Streptomyces monticola]|uniref:Uncharacterized protein n=1 Tax=Streptomyces monticola TaxID=2666263 RepID=A0ABW2JM00_9ACTN
MKLLNLDEHHRYDRESLSRYPRKSDGTIEWAMATDGSVLCSMDSDSIDMSSVIQQFAPRSGTLIFFWESLAVPSVEMGLESSLAHLPGITETFPEFWIYSPSDRVVVELSFSGVVTAAYAPADAGDTSSA